MFTKTHLLTTILGIAAGYGGSTALQTLAAAPGREYKVHVLEMRRLPALPDGGPAVALTAYGHRALPDGGVKDVGGHPCASALPLQTAADALLVASEACIHED